MNIIVPIKQVPETSNVKMDPETGTMVRSGVESVVNPLDLYALEAALSLKDSHGATVTAVTMGPPKARKVLDMAISMGCDDGVLVSDRKFGGADTWATSYTLSEAIKALGNVDLIIAGERATDGDTAQVGPGIAAWMNLPLATYISDIQVESDKCLIVERLVEEGYERLRLPLPALITVVKEIASPRLPTLRGKKKAMQTEIRTLSTENLTLESTNLGLKGSPTKVVKIETPKVTRGGTVVEAADDASVTEAVDRLMDFLRQREVV